MIKTLKNLFKRHPQPITYVNPEKAKHGDVLIAYVIWDNGQPITVPQNWKLLQSLDRCVVYYRILRLNILKRIQSYWQKAHYELAFEIANQNVVCIAAYRGIDQRQPFDIPANRGISGVVIQSPSG